MLINDDSCTFCRRLCGTLPSIMSEKPAGSGEKGGLERVAILGTALERKSPAKRTLKAVSRGNWRAIVQNKAAVGWGGRKTQEETPAGDPRCPGDEAPLSCASAQCQREVSGGLACGRAAVIEPMWFPLRPPPEPSVAAMPVREHRPCLEWELAWQ